jgi:hypothetical protein
LTNSLYRVRLVLDCELMAWEEGPGFEAG